MRGDSGDMDADAKEYRRLRELLKARLWAQRAGTPEDYISDEIKPLSAGYETPEALAQYQPFIPEPVRRAAELGDKLAREAAGEAPAGYTTPRPRRPEVWWFIDLRRRRKHRVTRGRKGPRIDDADLARAVHKLVAGRGTDRMDAERAVAQSLYEVVNIELKAARARIRRALRKLG